MAPREVAELIGFDMDRVPGPTYPCSGIASGGHAKRIDIHMVILSPVEPLEIDLPFTVIVDGQQGQSKEILIGRHPLFHDFDFSFRMGYTDDPEIGKFTIRGVRKRRDAGKYRQYPPVPSPDDAPGPRQPLRR